MLFHVVRVYWLGDRTAEDCKKAEHGQLHILSVRSRYQIAKRRFSEDLLEMQTVVLLTFLYLSLRTQENHLQRLGKLVKLL